MHIPVRDYASRCVQVVNVPDDSLWTLTTVLTGHKGSDSQPSPPAPSPFPFPFTETFDGYAEDSLARFFSDMVCV